MDEGRFSISADDLYQGLGSAAAPIGIGARGPPAFEADERMVVGAIRCNPEELAIWRHGRTDCRAECERFTVLLDGKVLFTTTDRIFADPGKVALWTKADSVTHFDAIEITPLP